MKQNGNNMTVDQQLPQNLDAEKKVLGACIRDTDALIRALDIITKDSFYQPSHQLIFDALQHLQKSSIKIDLLTLGDELERRGQLESVGGAFFLSEIVRSVTTSVNVDAHAEIVKTNYIRRRIIRLCLETQLNAFQGSDHYSVILDKLTSSIQLITIMETSNLKQIGEDVESTIGLIQERQLLSVQDEYLINPYDTGIYDVNKHTGGYNYCWLVIWAGAPNSGKSRMMLSQALYMQSGKPTVPHPSLIFSYEMNFQQIQEAVISLDSECNTKHGIEKSTADSIMASASRLGDYGIWVDSSCPSISQLESRAYKFAKEHPDGIIWIDYIQLIKHTDRYQKRHEIVADISRRLKLLTNEIKLPIVGLSQITREATKNRTKPGLGDLRESAQLEQDADLISFIWQEKTFKEIEDEHNCDPGVKLDYYPINVFLAKNRHGATKIDYQVSWMNRCAKFVDAAVYEFSKGNPPF